MYIHILRIQGRTEQKGTKQRRNEAGDNCRRLRIVNLTRSPKRMFFVAERSESTNYGFFSWSM